MAHSKRPQGKNPPCNRFGQVNELCLMLASNRISVLTRQGTGLHEVAYGDYRICGRVCSLQHVPSALQVPFLQFNAYFALRQCSSTCMMKLLSGDRLRENLGKFSQQM